MMKKNILEVCVDSAESALNAQKGGADRLELCADLIIGGTTPSLALFEQVKSLVTIPVHVLLRPRFGDFLYTSYELELLQKQASLFHSAGADALVIGCLTPKGRLDLPAMELLCKAAPGTPINLHRAFDMCRDLEEALDDAKKLGIVSILTSGGQDSAIKGAAMLDLLKKRSGQMEIMAAAGINAQVIQTLKEQTCLTSFHMSGKQVLSSQMEYRNPHVNMGLPSLSEYEIWQTSETAVRDAKKVLN